jgi:serine/threonine protein kinase/tetratricopeptide (TPR) repeat protein
VAKQKVAAAQIGDDDETLIFQADADSDETILMPGSEVEDPDATLLMPASEDEDADATLLMPGSEDEDADVDATLIYPIETDDSGTVIVSEPAQDQTVVEEQATSTRPEKQDDGPLELGREFGKRYHIIKLLGLGGMGAVYQAWDVVLGIVVALKVVRPEVGADPKMAEELDQRFKRELLLAREVTHKNVVRIHDLGEIDGIKYITMTFIDGEDLSSVLKRQGKLAVPEALHVFRSVLSGLLAVHEAGVVHRDLKPANIILGTEDKEAYLMDFGVARSSSESAPKPSIEGVPIEKLKIPELGQTMAGAVVGTLQYMAPEQFRGKIADQRSDLYTLGLILYDLLVGSNRAKSAKSAIKEVMKRSEEPPPAVRSLEPEVPEPLDRIVSRCLDPDPELRYQTTSELAAELDQLDEEGKLKPVKRLVTWRLMTAVGVAVVGLLAGTFWFASSRAPEAEPDPMSILIADVDNQTGDPTFDGALEESLAIAMEGASFISAFPRSSAQSIVGELMPGSSLDEDMARLVSRREGIDVILSGAISEKGSGYRITTRALDPALDSKAKPLASARASADRREGVPSAIGQLASDLRKRPGDTTPESARLAASETVTASSLEALQAYTRAQALADANKNEEALTAYQETIELDPNFGRAYAGMGVIYTIFKDEEKMKAAYDQALKLVDRMSEREKYRTLGTYYMSVARNYEKAIENYETLVELYPADDGAHANLGLAYVYSGDVRRAMEEARKVLDLYPSQWAQRYNYAMYAMYAGEFDTAIAEGSRVIDEVPSFELAFLPVALSKLALDDVEGALDTYSRLEQSGPAGASLARFGRADLELYHGRVHEALRILEPSIALDKGAGNTGILAQSYVAAAEAYLALGKTKRGIDAARKAAELSAHESVLFPAAQVLLRSGLVEEAEAIARALENRLQTLTIAYARLIDAEIAVSRGRYAEAIELFRDSIKRRDTWVARFLLGKLYVENGLFTEAMAELDLAEKRHGEVTDVFIYDTPSLRYLPELYYWLARAQQPIGVAEARQNYEKFLTLRADSDAADPLAADASNRWSSLDLADTG